MFQWQNYQAGHYAMGIEPSTNHVLGKPFAQERGELIWLEHGEERSYDADGGAGRQGGRSRRRSSGSRRDRGASPDTRLPRADRDAGTGQR